MVKTVQAVKTSNPAGVNIWTFFWETKDRITISYLEHATVKILQYLPSPQAINLSAYNGVESMII